MRTTSPVNGLGRFGRSGVPYVLTVALIACLGVVLDSYNLFIAATVVVYATAAMGQEILIGRAGQVSIGGAALMALGAYVVTQTDGRWYSAFPIPLLLAAIVGAVVGLITGLPALRLRGLYLLLTTLALHYLVQFGGYELAHKNPSGYDAPTIHLASWSAVSPQAIFFVLCGVAFVVAVVLHNLYRRSPGLIWSALREDEIGAATVAISGVRWKLLAFVISSSVTAVGGGLFAYLVGTATYDSFSLTIAINLIVMVFVGGAGSIAGACLGAAVVTLLPIFFTNMANGLPADGKVTSWLVANIAFVDTAVFGLALLLVLLHAPGGIVELLKKGGRAAMLLARRLRPEAPVSGSQRTVVPPSVSSEHVTAAATTEGTTGAPASGGFLEVQGLVVRYPNGALGTAGVSIGLPQGSVGALVGRNGAGKTSVMRAIAGFTSSERVDVQGRILVDGVDITSQTPGARTSRGVVLVPERDKVFPNLTVVQHLAVVGLNRAEIESALKDFPALIARQDAPAGLLSGGQRQLLALAMAMVRQPRLLLVDEVSQGLAPVAVVSFMEQLQKIRETSDITMLLSDQSAAMVAEAAEVLLPLELGKNAEMDVMEHFATSETGR